MTFFLLWYAVWLKEKIKTVMRTILAWVSIFILYTTATWITNAQLIYLEDTSVPPVLSYLNKFLAMQPKRSTSPAYSMGNKAFFEWFKNQIADLPAEDHLRTVAYTIEQLEKMSTEKVKDTYNLDKNIAIAILKWIYEMAEKEPVSWTSYTPTSSDKTTTKRYTTKKSNNSYYDLEIKPYQGKTYYIYTLQDTFSIKQADFHLANGSFYHCMYAQCNKVAFESSMNPLEVHIGFANGTEGKKINLQDSKINNNDDSDEVSVKDDKEDNWTPPKKTKKIAEETGTEDDLLNELTDLFWDII